MSTLNPNLNNPTVGDAGADQRLNELLSRLSSLKIQSDTPNQTPTLQKGVGDKNTGPYVPTTPASFQEAGVSEPFVEELISKYLLARGEATIRQISEQIKLPFAMCEQIVTRMKSEQLLGYAGQSQMNDYYCRLTDSGRDRAKRYSDICSYFGASPVSFQDYVNSVKRQTINDQSPSQADLEKAFSDLLISPDLLTKLGPAINSGRGMFLYGYPGNGKTSIAERVTASFGKHIWIPRAIMIDRDLVRIFDPMSHEEAPLEQGPGILADDSIDQRWVRIKRPTIVVGGELRMEHLEIQHNHHTGISEAPIQMKSNCGVLVIDDFGRQQISVDELLNRWIVPLEKRYDYLNTTSGKKVQVPFDQLVIFSTNLEPKDLVDDAFLRRIPYKIEVPNPPIKDFVRLFEIMCGVLGCPFDKEMIKYLIETHYLPNNRPFRNCHPRDLLLQVKNLAKFRKQPFVLTKEGLDLAVENYFSMM